MRKYEEDSGAEVMTRKETEGWMNRWMNGWMVAYTPIQMALDHSMICEKLLSLTISER
jgi:hypothetical protein